MAKYNYGRSFTHKEFKGKLCYRYENRKKSTKTLVYLKTKKPVGRFPLKNLRDKRRFN